MQILALFQQEKMEIFLKATLDSSISMYFLFLKDIVKF